MSLMSSGNEDDDELAELPERLPPNAGTPTAAQTASLGLNPGKSTVLTLLSFAPWILSRLLASEVNLAKFRLNAGSLSFIFLYIASKA